MRVNAMEEQFEDVTVLGHPMIFTYLRVDRATVPEGLYVYEVRHDDDQQGDPVQIGNWILVNHWGTIISNKPIHLRNNGYRDIDPEEDWAYEGTVTTVKEYLQRCDLQASPASPGAWETKSARSTVGRKERNYEL